MLAREKALKRKQKGFRRKQNKRQPGPGAEAATVTPGVVRGPRERPVYSFAAALFLLIATFTCKSKALRESQREKGKTDQANTKKGRGRGGRSHTAGGGGEGSVRP